MRGGRPLAQEVREAATRTYSMTKLAPLLPSPPSSSFLPPPKGELVSYAGVKGVCECDANMCDSRSWPLIISVFGNAYMVAVS